MKRRVIVEKDKVVHVPSQAIGTVLSVGLFDGLTPDPRVRRDKHGNILKAYYVQTEQGLQVCARNEIRMCSRAELRQMESVSV